MPFPWLEMVGFSVTLVSVWLVIKERRSGWIWSILSAVTYFFVYLEANLYSDAEIQFLYMAVGIYGYINWNHRKREGAPVIKMVTNSSFLLYVLTVVAVAAIWGGIHSRVSDASLPYLDALLASTCIMAQWMMARKYFQCWYLWIFAGIGYIWMYAVKELAVTTLLYIILFGFTLYGYWQWRITKKLIVLTKVT